MKVGILTFHFGENYGALLQCWSLCQIIKEMGHEVEVIDYRPRVTAPLPLWKGWGFNSKNRAEAIRRRFLELTHRKKRKAAFDAFRKERLTFSARCSSMQEVACVSRGYDALIAGSDQVWSSPFWDPPVYFLDVPEFKGRRISYAPCCGFQTALQGSEGAAVRAALGKIDALSVRNKETYEWVCQESGLSPAIVADPTLLCDPPAAEPCVKGSYILAYIIDQAIPGGHRAAIEQIKKAHGDLPVVGVVSERYAPAILPLCDYVVWQADPFQFVSLIQNAAFVYTDSFHGIIYAIKARRPLVAYSAVSWRTPRMRDLSMRYGLENALVESVQDGIERHSFRGGIDYARVEALKKQHIGSSLEFLQRALS